MAQIQFGDPGNNFIREVKLHERQADFCSIPDTVFEALYGGAAYGGKSFLLTLLPLIRGFYKFRGFKGIILRRKFPDLEREIIRLSKEFYPITGAVYNETKHSWEWKEYGSYMDFGHVQHSSDIKQYDSAQYNYCAFDELTHFEESMYIYMVGSRVRPGNSFNTAIVRNGTNPGGVGQTFVYNRFVKPAEDGYILIEDKKTTLKRIYIPCLPQDNPYGMAFDPDYLNKLEILSEADKKAKKFGDWHAFEGSVFPEFRPFKFPNEPSNALHVIQPFDIPEWWPRILSIDWGKRAMCHAMWAAFSPENRLYIYRERGWKGVDVPFWASEIGELSFKENLVACTMCGSAWQESGVETIAQQFQRYSGIRPESSENTAGSRVSGLQTIHDFLRWTPKTRHIVNEQFDLNVADEIFRKFGADAKAKYLLQFQDEPEEKNLPKIQIFEGRAPILVETIPVVVYHETKKEDIAEFDGDDAIDNFRYLCKTANRFFSGLGEESERRRIISEALGKLQRTGDQTTFYRHMESIEAGQRKGFGVRRHQVRR